MFLKVVQHVRCYARFVKHLNPHKNVRNDGFVKKITGTETNSVLPKPVQDKSQKYTLNREGLGLSEGKSGLKPRARPTSNKGFPKEAIGLGTETKPVLPKPFQDYTQKSTVKREDLGLALNKGKSEPTPSPTSNTPSNPTSASVPRFSKVEELDKTINSILASIKSRKQREKSNRVLLEGKRLIRDAIENGAIPEIVLFSRVEDIKNLSLPESGVQLFKIPYKTISLWSDTSTCPGVMAILKTPLVNLKKPSEGSLPLTVICDNIRDPGNLGAVLRTVAAVGCKQLLVTKGCVDLWEPKVLRSAAGAHFHLPIHKNVSFNMLDTFIETDSVVYIADNNAVLTRDDIYTTDHGTFGRLVPIIPYSSVDFTHPQSVVLIIGGETEGVSASAMELACNRHGTRLHIPLANGIESLNTASALSVILFEVKRQLSFKMSNSYNNVVVNTESHSQQANSLDEKVIIPSL